VPVPRGATILLGELTGMRRNGNSFTPHSGGLAISAIGDSHEDGIRARRYEDMLYPRDLRRTTVTDGIPTVEQQAQRREEKIMASTPTFGRYRELPIGEMKPMRSGRDTGIWSWARADACLVVQGGCIIRKLGHARRPLGTHFTPDSRR